MSKRMAVRMMPAARTIAKRRGEKTNVLREIVSAAHYVTVGSCTIRRDKYDVDEDAGGVDGTGRTR